MMEAKFPVLKIVKVLDKTTLVLTGQGLDELREGEKLMILGRGPALEEVGGVPIVVEKAEVTITANAGEYVIACPPAEQVEEPVGGLAYAMYGLKATRTVTRREPLRVTESELSGNPGTRAIAIGDPAIRRSDYKEYVQSLKPSPLD